MPHPNDELDDEFEDSVDPVTEEDEEYEDDDDEEDEAVSPRSQGVRPRANPLQATVDNQATEIAELKNRLGNAVRIHGQEKKKLEGEIDTWIENLQTWQDQKLGETNTKSFAAGVKSVEDRLLPLLLPEEKGVYLEGLRANPHAPSPLQPVAPTQRRQRSQEATEDLSELVESFTAQGVPLDEIEQTSAKAVVDSGTRWLKAQIAEAKDAASSAANRVERAERDATGATRVSSGNPGGRTVRSKDADRLKEVTQALAKLRQRAGNGTAMQAAPLLREKRDLEAKLASRGRR